MRSLSAHDTFCLTEGTRVPANLMDLLELSYLTVTIEPDPDPEPDADSSVASRLSSVYFSSNDDAPEPFAELENRFRRQSRHRMDP